jgi:iron complex transport system ATP-binding protein
VTAVQATRVSVALDGVSILREVSVAVAPGAWLAVIGPNGAGKTTLLRAVAGLVPSTGELLVQGRRAHGVGRRALSRMVAYVPQRPVTPEGMTVTDYVLLGRTPYIAALGAESRRDLEVAASVMDRLDLSSLRERTLGTLSGGELQRAILARSLAQEAPVLLLDEPTSSLDIGHGQQVLELIDSLREDEGLAILSAMHDLTLAGQFADRLVLLAGGAVVADGPPGEVLTEALIGEHYGADVRVVEDSQWGLVVAPARPGRALRSSSPRRS